MGRAQRPVVRVGEGRVGQFQRKAAFGQRGLEGGDLVGLPAGVDSRVQGGVVVDEAYTNLLMRRIDLLLADVLVLD